MRGSRSWRRIILQDKDVESVSSFIGIDGTNSTLNSGRIQINLKDREQRKSSALEVIQRLEPQVAKVDGIQCFLQPLQDLTVEDRVSRTQYQYSVEDANAEELALWTDRLVAKLKTDSDSERRGERPATGRPGGESGDRPRYGVAAGDYAAEHRRHAG